MAEAGHTPTLRACPLCNGKAAFATVTYCESMLREQGWDQDTFHYVSCIVCAANNRGLVGHRNQATAAEKWNRRPGESALLEALKAARTALNEDAAYFEPMADADTHPGVAGHIGNAEMSRLTEINETLAKIDAALAQARVGTFKEPKEKAS